MVLDVSQQEAGKKVLDALPEPLRGMLRSGRDTHPSMLYKFTRPDGVVITTIMENGKAHIMEERGEGVEQSIVMLERSQLTDAERALIQEVSAIA